MKLTPKQAEAFDKKWEARWQKENNPQKPKIEKELKTKSIFFGEIQGRKVGKGALKRGIGKVRTHDLIGGLSEMDEHFDWPLF